MISLALALAWTDIAAESGDIFKTQFAEKGEQLNVAEATIGQDCDDALDSASARRSLDSGAKRNGVKRSGFAHPFQARQAELGEAS